MNRLKQGIFHFTYYLWVLFHEKKNKQRKLLNRLTYDFNITNWGLSLGDS
jgi:hypothetical protein